MAVPGPADVRQLCPRPVRDPGLQPVVGDRPGAAQEIEARLVGGGRGTPRRATRFPGCASAPRKARPSLALPTRHAAASFSRTPPSSRSTRTETYAPANRRTPGRTGSRCMGVAGRNLDCAAGKHPPQRMDTMRVPFEPRSLLRGRALHVSRNHLQSTICHARLPFALVWMSGNAFLNTFPLTSGTAVPARGR